MILERTTVHVSDDTGRIAMLEARTYGTDPSPAVLQRYIYSNHLQSASLELDEAGEVISYEEYHPYGTTSYQAMNVSINAVAKRYRYTGKERDEESGLYYHGARYYIPWLCRWTAVDGLESEFAGRTPYSYCANNPVKYFDPSGMLETEPPRPQALPELKPPPGYKEPKPIPTKQSEETFDLNPPIKPPEEPLLDPTEIEPQLTEDEPYYEEPIPEPQPEPIPTEQEESTAKKIADTALDFVPIIGGIKDIIKGIKNGDGLSVAIGVVSIVVDVATAGGASVIKGAVKTVAKEVIEKGAKEIAISTAEAIAKKRAIMKVNKKAGDAFRDELAEGLEKEGREVIKEYVVKTPIGTRRLDILVKKDGKIMGGIEAKVGKSRYTTYQRIQDKWIQTIGGRNKDDGFVKFSTNLVRKP